MTTICVRDRDYVSVNAAVLAHLTHTYHGQGAVEDAAQVAQNTTECLANLIELLHDIGYITTENIEKDVLKGLYAY